MEISDSNSNLLIAKGSDSRSDDIKVCFNLAYGSNLLFQDATLSLNHGKKYGLLGPNGSGKSTLLKNIAARRNEFQCIPSHFSILHIEQEPEPNDLNAIESVISGDLELTLLLAEEKRLLQILASTEQLHSKLSQKHHQHIHQINSSSDLEMLNIIQSRLSDVQASSAVARASSILSGLQFTEEMKVKKTKEFSGGWQMRISLARALFCKPTLLLLDEPTNHLDLPAVIWLESYLSKWGKTLLIVSHDQSFLNSVCTDVIHIHRHKLVYYSGNYDIFKRLFAAELIKEKLEHEKYIKRLKEAQRSKYNQAKKEVIKVEKGRDRKLVKAKETTLFVGKKPEREYSVNFKFPDCEPIKTPLLSLDQVSFSGISKNANLNPLLDISIGLNSRIALVGKNGFGKSTLLKILEGNLQPDIGAVFRSRKLIIGRFAQHFVDQLDMNQTPIEYLLSKFSGYDELQVRGMLGRFGLSGKVHLRKLCTLSGGQKSRVVFAELSMRSPHILLLDEPTNHLDIESVEALGDALDQFNGAFVLISHDSRLIERSCKTIWVVEDGKVEEFKGDFKDYREYVQCLQSDCI